MKKIFPLVVLGLLVIGTGLSACNTVDGFGRDMEKAGKTIQGR